jgi:lysyl-tRNA synthetase class 2
MDESIRRGVVATGRVLTVVVSVMALSSAAIGILYLLRGPTAGWPGPRLFDVLPLDELPGHADVPLILFAVTMAVAGLLAGGVASALGFDGFAISLSVGVGVGVWLYLSSALSIFIVRQVSLVNAIDSTRNFPSVYLAAVLYALASAALAHRHRREQWLTRLVPAGVGILGVITILVATLPDSPGDRVPLGGLLTGADSSVARTIGVAIGVVLLLCARGLGRRSRRACISASVLVFVSLVVRTIDAFNVTALAVGSLVLISLIARRGDFSFAGDPSMRASATRRVVIFAGITLAYGVAALWINQIAFDLPFHFLAALRGTLHALVIGSPQRWSPIAGHFSTWFPWSLRLIACLGIAWAASTWFAPWRHRPVDESLRRRVAEQVVRRWGEDTLAPFTLRRDKAHYLFPEASTGAVGGTTLISYRVVRGVAIVSGDPIGPPDQARDAVAAFRAMCAARGWTFALLGASDRFIGIYRELGFHALYHGDEAIIDIASFTLVGGERKSVRQAVKRVARKGYEVAVYSASELDQELRAELSLLERESLGGRERKGFVMELEELFRLDGNEVLYVTGRAPDGSLVGFLEIASCPPSASLSLSSMPRSPAAPNGMNAFLIVSLVEWARERSFEAVSLNFSPAARLFAHGQSSGGKHRIARWATRIPKRLFGLQLDNLYRFNQGFTPRWQPRYVIVDRVRDIPRVVVAAMAAERYVPFASFLRGRDWPIPPAVNVDGALNVRSP